MEEICKPCFDLERICDFITYSDTHKIKDVELLITTGDNIEENGERFNSKTVRENTISSNPQIDTIRYDLVKTLMTIIIDSNMSERNEEDGLTIGEQLAINTLIENKMLKI
jgi:hypothetical protein